MFEWILIAGRTHDSRREGRGKLWRESRERPWEQQGTSSKKIKPQLIEFTGK